jgi:hypothetical protein
VPAGSDFRFGFGPDRRGSGDNPAPMTFDEALAGLLALVGERVEVHVMDAGD